MNHRVTIKDVAGTAGVSVSTVSRVINNHPSVNEKTRRHVKKVIEQIGFHPNEIARSMVSSKTNDIAVVVSDITNPYFTDLVAHIDRCCRKLGFSMVLFDTASADVRTLGSAANEDCATFRHIEEKRADGVIILGGELDRAEPSPSYLKSLNSLCAKLPSVIVGDPIESVEATFLPRAQHEAVALCVQHLLARGANGIGFIGGEGDVRVTQTRIRAFKESLATYQNVVEDWIVPSDFYTQSGYDAMERILDLADIPQAVVAINDRVALGAIRALADHGFSCPRDMAVASCDMFPDGDFFSPRLTTVDQNNDLLARAAVESCIARIRGEEAIIRQAPAPKLIIRESCLVERARP